MSDIPDALKVDVSILITYYNQKEYIQYSLKSVLKQKTSYSFEILCGDDGSSDGTYEELLKFEKEYPTVIRVFKMPREDDKQYEPIHRVSRNRLNLLKHATGRYLCFLDGDDSYIDNNKLQKQISIMDLNKDCFACGHPFRYLYDGTNELGDIQYTSLPQRAIKLGVRTYWSFVWLHADSFVFRNPGKEIQKIINPDFFDDNLITAHFVKYGSVIFLPDPMIAYRQVEKSSWNQRNELQKAFVNMRVYQEATRVFSNNRVYSFLRTIDAWRTIYSNRNMNFDIDKGMKEILDISFVNDTIKYKQENIIFRLKYQMKYGIIPAYCFMAKIMRKLCFIFYRKVQDKQIC